MQTQDTKNLDAASTAISEALGDIRNSLNKMYLELSVVKKDIDAMKSGRRINGELICQRLDHMLIGLSRVGLFVKEMSPPGLFDTFAVKNPNAIDTKPLDIYEQCINSSQEIQQDIVQQCQEFGKTMTDLTKGRDSVQCLSDYVSLLKRLREDLVSRRNRVESLKQRKRDGEKGSNEERNATFLIAKVKGLIRPLEAFSEFVLDSYCKKRKKMMSEIWRTTVAIEEMYDTLSKEYKETIPKHSSTHSIQSALKEMSDITRRHIETDKANRLVKSGDMTALERRKMLAGLKH